MLRFSSRSLQWRVQCGRRRKYKKGEVGGGDLGGDRNFGIYGGRS